MFSASNKIWNLQALMEAGADGFIIKESPENSVDETFTSQSINSIYKTIDECLNRAFLKNIYSAIQNIKSQIRKSIEHATHTPEQKEAITTFEGFTVSMMEASFDIIHNINFNSKKSKLRSVFLFLYQILEDYVKLNCIYQEGDMKHPSIVFKKDRIAIEVFGPDTKIPGNVTCNISLKQGRYL